MAKESKNKNTGEQGEKKKSPILAILFLLIFTILAVLIGMGIVIKLDMLEFGTKLAPTLKNNPITSLLIPANYKEPIVTTVDNKYNFTTTEAAITALKKVEQTLEETLMKNTKEAENLNVQIDTLQKEVDRLKEFEANYEVFIKDKEAFDQTVVFNDKAPDLSEYIKFYEQLNPDNAAKIYEQALKKNAYDSSVLDYATTLGAMKATEAAPIIQNLSTNIEMVVQILEQIPQDQRAKIIAQLDQKTAAKIIQFGITNQ